MPLNTGPGGPAGHNSPAGTPGQCVGQTGVQGNQYSYAQLEGLWINAGGSRALAPVAAAIAMAESGGCSAAVNPTDNGGTQTSWGLWQLSDGTHNQPVKGILDPATNASQAVAKQKANGWGPWGTYTSGAYKAFLNSSTSPDTNVPGSNQQTSQDQGAPGCPPTCITCNFPHTSWCPFTKTEARALLGGLLIGASGIGLIVGLAVMIAGAFSQTKAGQKAAGLAEKAGAGLALVPGMEGVGAGIAATSAAAKKGGSAASARRTQRRRQTVRTQNAAEDAELEARGATDIRTARKPPGTLTRTPGRGVKTGEINPGGRQGAQPRTVRPRAATREEAGF